MSAQQINVLEAVNQLMVRRGIALGKLARAYMAGVKYNTPELVQLRTFAQAALSRSRHLMAQIG